MKYQDIDKKIRSKLAYELLANFYPAAWINWCEIYTTETGEVLESIFDELSKYEGKTLTEVEINIINDKFYQRIFDVIVQGYTDDLKELVEAGNSWTQTINESIQDVIKTLCQYHNVVFV